MDKKYSEINSSAMIEVNEKTKAIKDRLENTLYKVVLSHKQIAMIISNYDSVDGTDLKEDESELLDLLENSEVSEVI